MKCRCSNPNWWVDHIDVVKLGKNIGKKIYTCSCSNCGAIWTTQADYARGLKRTSRCQ